MAAKIDYSIPAQRFELIRNKIALILAEELANQADLQTNDLFDATVFVERLQAFNEAELPCVNVSYSQGDTNDNKALQSATMTHIYSIDAYVNATSTASERADKTANFNVQKLIGVIRAILENAQYRTLELSGIVENVMVTGITLQEPLNIADAANFVYARLIFAVRCEEVAGGYTPTAGEIFISTIKFNETEEGFIISNTNNI